MQTDDVSLIGRWSLKTNKTSAHGTTFYTNELEPNVVFVFHGRLPAAGKWQVALSYVAASTREAAVPVLIYAAAGPVSQWLNQRKQPTEPPFQPVAVFSFAAGQGDVEINTVGVTGRVIADAVRFTCVP